MIVYRRINNLSHVYVMNKDPNVQLNIDSSIYALRILVYTHNYRHIKN